MVLVSSLRPLQDMPSLCTIVVSTLWVQHPSSSKAMQQLWDDSRRLEFHTYCQSVLSYLSISPSVTYTSLKYIQNYLSSLPASVRTTLAYGSERAIFVIALLLAYKFVEDCGSVDSNYWSQASMIPVSSLRKMEIDFLCQVDHKLHVDEPAFVGWVSQCNATFDQSLYLCTMSTTFTFHSQLPDKLYHQYYSIDAVADSNSQYLLHPCYYYTWHHHNVPAAPADPSWNSNDAHMYSLASPTAADSCNFMSYGTYPEMGPYLALPPMPMQ